MARKPYDSRRHPQQTQGRLVVGGFLLLVVVGGGLILIIYGPAAAVTGLACIGAGIGMLVLIWGILKLMERLVKEE
jgi:hypothetical protein